MGTVDDGSRGGVPGGDLVLRFGELGFRWKADSRKIELLQASDEGVPAPDKPAAIALLEPYHFLEGMTPVQRDEADFRIFCEEFLQGMATAEIVDETPEALGGGITDAQVSPRLDAIREGMAQIRRLSEHEGDVEAISWGDAIVAAVLAAYDHDVKDPGSSELGGIATAIANLLGIHAGELHTDEQIEARVLGHPAARAYFWLREEELERVNAGEVLEIGPWKVSATPLDDHPLPSPQRQRAELVLGNAVHPAALDRLFELWPTAHVVVRHSLQFNDGVPIKVTHIEVWDRPPGEAGPYPELGIAKCRLDVDSWERRRGIGLAFKRALLRVKSRAIEEAS
jgi:hypothetical protein